MRKLVIAALVGSILLLLVWLASAANITRGVEAYRLGDYAGALEEFGPLADEGNAKAQMYLGVMYAKGEGVEKKL